MSRYTFLPKRNWKILAFNGFGYFALIIFFKFSFGVVENGCRFQNNCFQFCCEDRGVCDENYIKNYLNDNYDSFYDKCNGAFDYKHDDSSCLDDSVYRSLLSHGKDGKIFFDKRANRNENHCNKDYFKASVTFAFDFTINQVFYREIFDYFFFASSVLMMTATAMTAIFFRKFIVTITAKIEFCLMMSLMFFFVTISSSMFVDSKNKISICLMAIGFLKSLLWFTVMNYDVWRTTRKVQATPDRYFQFYCFFSFGVVGGFSVVLLWSSFSSLAAFTTILMICLITPFIIYLVSLLFIVRDTRKVLTTISETFEGQSWFEGQVDRYLLSGRLILIFLVVCILRVTAMFVGTESYLLFSNAITCYSAFWVFGIFATRKEARKILMDNYRSLEYLTTEDLSPSNDYLNEETSVT